MGAGRAAMRRAGAERVGSAAREETGCRTPLHGRKRVLTFRLLCLSVYTCLINESRTFQVPLKRLNHGRHAVGDIKAED